MVDVDSEVVDDDVSPEVVDVTGAIVVEVDESTVVDVVKPGLVVVGVPFDKI